MGLHQSTIPHHPSSHIHYQQQNWLLLQKIQSNVTTTTNPFTIIKNKITNQFLRSYTVNFNNKKDFDIYVEQFDEWRAMGHWNIIEAKYLVVVDQEPFGIGGLCSGSYQLKIFVQNPVITLSEIKDIPVPQSFYILLSALVGFQHLFQVFGYFPLSQNMITINQLGLIKVWIHPDLSQNRPYYHSPIPISLQHMQSPTRFIQQLITLIQNNTDSHQLPSSFSQFLDTSNKSPLTFGNCRKLLLNFAQQNKIDIPDSLVSILDLLFEKTNRSSISQQQQQNLIDHENQSNALYGKNYRAGGYLLDGEYYNHDSMGEGNNDFTSGDQSNPHDYKLQSRGEMIESFQQYPQSNQQISRQANNIVQRTKSNHNQTPSQSSNHISSRQMSYNTLSEQKNIMIGVASQSLSPFSHYEHGHHHQHSHRSIYTNAYQSSSQKIPQLPLIINFTHNSQAIYSNDNSYNSLVQRQAFQRQSTIREQPYQDSFLTSDRKSKFHTSRDLRRISNQLKKTYKNMQTHRQTFSSHSESRLNVDNSSPRHLHVRENSQTIKNLIENQKQQTKRSGKIDSVLYSQ